MAQLIGLLALYLMRRVRQLSVLRSLLLLLPLPRQYHESSARDNYHASTIMFRQILRKTCREHLDKAIRFNSTEAATQGKPPATPAVEKVSLLKKWSNNQFVRSLV